MPKRRVTSCLRMLSISSIVSDIKSMKTRRPRLLHLLGPPSPASPFFLFYNNSIVPDDPAAIHGFNASYHYSAKQYPISQKKPISENPCNNCRKPTSGKITSENPRAEGITSEKPKAKGTISGNPDFQILTSRNSDSKRASSANLNSERPPTPPNPNSKKPTSQHACLLTPDNNGQSHMSTSVTEAFTETGEPLSSSSPPLLWTALFLGLLWTFLLLTGKGIAVTITIATHLAHVHSLNLRSMQMKMKMKMKEKIRSQDQSMAIDQDTNVFHGSDQIGSKYWNRVGGLTKASHSSGSLHDSSLNHPLHDPLCLKLQQALGVNPLHSSVVTEKDKVLQTETCNSNIGSKTITFTPTFKLQLMLLMALLGLFHGRMIAMCVAPSCILLVSKVLQNCFRLEKE